MRDKILKSKCLHIELPNQAVEIHSDITISGPEDFKNKHGIKCRGIWDTGSEGCLISPALSKKLNLVLISYKIVIGVTGAEESPEFLVNIFLPNGDAWKCNSSFCYNYFKEPCLDFYLGNVFDLTFKADTRIRKCNLPCVHGCDLDTRGLRPESYLYGRRDWNQNLDFQ